MITVCGRPNVGKSSLTNALVGEKIAIVSDKPQTTRNRIYGVVNRGDTQYVLLDTPGLHKPRSRLGDYMVKVVRESLSDVECALLLVEPIAHVGDSRCYHFRKKEDCIFQTQDHVKDSFGWEIVARCFFTGRPDVAIPEIHQAILQRGDKILLCSDGLYKSMPPDMLKERVMDEKSPAEILDEFDSLCAKNGDDNYSGILLEILDI